MREREREKPDPVLPQSLLKKIFVIDYERSIENLGGVGIVSKFPKNRCVQTWCEGLSVKPWLYCPEFILGNVENILGQEVSSPCRSLGGGTPLASL